MLIHISVVSLSSAVISAFINAFMILLSLFFFNQAIIIFIPHFLTSNHAYPPPPRCFPLSLFPLLFLNTLFSSFSIPQLSLSSSTPTLSTLSPPPPPQPTLPPSYSSHLTIRACVNLILKACHYSLLMHEYSINLNNASFIIYYAFLSTAWYKEDGDA